MSQHKQIEQLLSTYNELSFGERQLVEQHVKTCRACSATLAIYQRMDNALMSYTDALIQQAKNGPAVNVNRVSKTKWAKRVARPRHAVSFMNLLPFRPAALSRGVGVAIVLLLIIVLATSGAILSDDGHVVTAATPTQVPGSSHPMLSERFPPMSAQESNANIAPAGNDDEKLSPEIAISVSPPPPAPYDQIDYGVTAFMQGEEEIERTMDSVNDLGFNWVRNDVHWKAYEPVPGQVEIERLREMVAHADESNVSLLFTIQAAPDWAREVDFDAKEEGPPADPQTLAAFAGHLAQEFCGSSLKAIEVWREQNLRYAWGNKSPSAGEYMALLAATSTSVKEACPAMAVISGGITPAGRYLPQSEENLAYFEQMLAFDLPSYVDGIGVILPGYNLPPIGRWEEACDVATADQVSFQGACDSPHRSWSFLSTLEAYEETLLIAQSDDPTMASIPFWVTEFGWASGKKNAQNYQFMADNSREEQAQWSVDAFRILAHYNIGPAFIWNLDGQVSRPQTYMAQWGIVDEEWNPLPVYNALKAMEKIK